MVRPGGFEPPTSWSVARRSIQLIYGRTLIFKISGGEGGIRTLGEFPHTRLAGVRLQPLGHLSATHSFFRNLAEDEGLEPPWDFSRRFSRPLPYQLGLVLRLGFSGTTVPTQNSTNGASICQETPLSLTQCYPQLCLAVGSNPASQPALAVFP